jgi:folate-binding protein YgfZ
VSTEPVAHWVPRDVVRVVGTDAASFLQGQLSQDVAALGEGGSAWSFLLQPTGKVAALVRVVRLADNEFVLDTDAGWGEAVIDRLNRFKLRVRVEIEALPWRCLAVRGVSVEGAVPAFGEGADLLGEDPAVPEGARLGDLADYERLRIVHTWPAMGSELTERTIPAETGIVDRTVSFTKGCYTGQELVARIDSRGGHVPRHLRTLRVEQGAEVGDPVVVDGREVGTLTSVAGTVALAYVHRSAS